MHTAVEAELLRAWIERCERLGPPTDSWLHEIEPDYRYRYRILELDTNVEFIALVHERRMLLIDLK